MLFFYHPQKLDVSCSSWRQCTFKPVYVQCTEWIYSLLNRFVLLLHLYWWLLCNKTPKVYKKKKNEANFQRHSSSSLEQNVASFLRGKYHKYHKQQSSQNGSWQQWSESSKLPSLMKKAISQSRWIKEI